MQCNSQDVALVEASLLKVAGSMAEQDGGFGLLFTGFGSLFQAPNPMGKRAEGQSVSMMHHTRTVGAFTRQEH